MEFKLHFDGDDDDAFNYMTVELDGENMPHTTYTFLSQVDYGLYQTSGFAFHHNARHIVFGSPMANHLNPNEEESWGRWENSGVERLLFKEYSPEMPHVEYSMGFSGTGPNLYFNTMDNTEAHGSIEDPCFGKVTRGWEVIDRMHSASGELVGNDWKELQPGSAVVQSIVLVR